MKEILKDSRTNWKYILIVVILAFLVGGGIWGYYWCGVKELKAPGEKISEVVREEISIVEQPQIQQKITVTSSSVS